MTASGGDYVREYFDRHAAEWLDQAYAEGESPPVFPLGDERVRLALHGVAESAGSDGRIVDLGCGGGQLCIHAARLGLEVVGVDVAPSMIAEAEQLRARLPANEASRTRFVVAPFDENELPAEGFDAVTALGLIEYLDDDGPLFAEARRLLRPGGRFAVSCRNRLFNVQSANAFTEGEIETGSAAALVAELAGSLTATEGASLHALARELAAAAPALIAAADADASEPPPELFDHRESFAERRRQHTPAELSHAAADFRFEPVATLALHPHPLPPALERLSPRVYNRLALAWQRALESSPTGLAFSSAFVGVFERKA
jgi:SAM-dependent methyltransferase